MADKLLEIFLTIPALLIAFSVKEYARARVADMLGDKTPRLQGHLTLDPFAHIDIMGLIFMLFLSFGWSKAVQINRNAFKNPRRDALKVNFAALFSNLFVAFIASLFYVLLIVLFGERSDTMQIISLILYYIIMINVNLFVFNILPLPGLDGFRILEDLFPSLFHKIAGTIYRYYVIILIAVLLIGSNLLIYPCSYIINAFINMWAIIL